MATHNEVTTLRGRNVLVIGGTRGIGGGIALRLASAGARVLASYVRNHAAASQLQERATAEGLWLHTVKADVSHDTGLVELIAQTKQHFTQLDALVFCAATGVHKPISELTGRHFDFTFGLNTRAFVEALHKLDGLFVTGSTILALSSDGAQRAIPTYALVGASKAALESLVRNAAVELGRRGIRVNALSPGTVQTDVWRALPNAQQRLDEAARRSPTGRLVTVDEVADVALFLVSEAARGISGQTIIVDGGARVVG